MPGELVSRPQSGDFTDRSALAPAAEWGPPAAGGVAPPAPVASGGIKRYVAALKRYKWLFLPILLVGTVVGLVATRFLHPLYAAQARVWISEEGMSDEAGRQGPIRSEGIVRNAAWIELFNSYVISDAVVRRMGLFVDTDEAKDSLAFRGFSLAERFVPGGYYLKVDDAKRRYTLFTSTDQTVDSGAVGDSIGRKVGFLWAPAPESLKGRKKIEFTVLTPREASLTLQKRLKATIPENTNFIQLALSDTRPDRAAATLNAWLDEFVNVAAQLKRYKLTEQAKILNEQLATARQNLQTRQSALQSIKVNKITEPTQGLTVSPGQVSMGDPVMGQYFQQKVEYETVKRDREALQEALRNPTTANLLGVLSVSNSPAAMTLRGAIGRLDSAQANLRALRQVYTDDYEKVRRLLESRTAVVQGS